MRILQVISSINPSLGGPVESLKQFSIAFENIGIANEIVTLDKPNSNFHWGKSIKIHAMGPSLGKYSVNIRFIPWLIKHVDDYDIILCRGIWRFHSCAIWIVSLFKKISYFVFIHGALDPWFKQAFPLKHIKKTIYWYLIEYNVLRSANAVLYTSEDEKELASQTFKLDRTNGIVTNYGIGSPEGDEKKQKDLFLQTYPHLLDKKIFLFISRIHQKKGCDMLISAFAKIAEKDPELHLVLAGPDEIKWKPKLQELARKYHIEDRITWTGMLTGDIKWGAYYSASCFVLPSHSENFGIVVVEALACGLPVIITNKINIWKEIVSENAGIVGKDTIDGTIDSMNKWLRLNSTEKETMRNNAKRCFKKNFEVGSAIENFLEIISLNSHKRSAAQK